MTLDWIGFRFEDRPALSKKGDFGKVAIVGGSNSYPNTPAICALAAIRTGADVTKIIAPERASNACATFAPDLITVPLEGERLSPANQEQIVQYLDGHECMIIGNGLGGREKTAEAVAGVLEETELPVVIDAEALTAGLKEIDLEGRDTVLTPNRWEFEQLYEEPSEELAVVKEQVKKAARIYDSVMVLKAPKDIISDGESVYVNETGNPYMTKGGTGDVVAGVCGALLCLAEPLEAGFLAAHITGKAGDIAASSLKQSIMLEDVLESIPKAMDSIAWE